jgi:tetratricopeptide (TPR) repeat protein
VAVLIVLVVAGCERARVEAPPRELLEKAWSHFRLEEFEEAREAFAAALEKVADAKDGPEAEGPGERERLQLNATYGLALVASLAHHGEEPAEARRLFERVIALDHSPTRETAAWAALALVRDAALPATADAAIDRAAVSAGYGEVMEKYPATPAAEEAFLYRTAMLVETLERGDARRAVEEVRAYMGAHPAARLRTALFALESTAHGTLGEYREALAAAIASVESKEADPANPQANTILEYYRIGMMAQFDVGDFATARAYYAKFLAEYPRDQRAFVVRLLLEHLDRTEVALREGRAVPELSGIVRGGAEVEGESAGEAFGRRLKAELRAGGGR